MQKKQPLISIIIPVYNVEKYLSECLTSLINQTYKNLEIICIDDGSTDNCAKILKNFASVDSRIKIITTKNQGQSSARNTGLNSANGDYIGFVDSDDWISENYYNDLLNACIKNNADVAYGQIKYVEQNNNTYYLIKHQSEQIIDNFVDMLKYQNNGSICSKLYKRSILYKNNKPRFLFPTGLRWEDSYFLILTLNQSKKQVLVPTCCYFYRLNNTSTMHNIKNQEINTKNRIEISKLIWDLFKETPKYHDIITDYIINVVFDTNIIQKNHTIKKHIENMCNINITSKYTWKTSRISFYFFGFLQLLRYVNDIHKKKIYIMYIPFVKYYIENCVFYLYLLGLSIFKKDYQKFRLFLFGIPLLKIRWDNIFGIYLFHIIPIIKFKKGE